MKKEIINCLTWFANEVTATNIYGWDSEYRKEHIKNSSKRLYEELKKFIDFNTITQEEARELRFRRWDEDYPNLYLFPLWLVPLIPEGLMVTDIGGNTYPYKKDKADNDIRFGCVAYGINIER